jgi:GT2 family glycosyltransferase
MLVIIIVSWNVCARLRACLHSLQQHASTSHPQCVVVVDNASSDDSAQMVREEYPHVTLIANTTNRGFTGGNNDGIAAAEPLFAGADPSHSYILLLNPDTEVLPGALDQLLAFAGAHPAVGMVGPQLRYPDGSIQSSRRRFPTLASAIFESTWLQGVAPRGILDRFYMRDMPDDQVCDVDWVYGAAMLVRRSTYLQCGVLDERTFFMYSEEVDWCRRIKSVKAAADQGWRVVYLPQAAIIHYEAQSSTQVSARRMIYFNTSKVRYFRKHHGRGQATVLRATLLTQFAYQLLLESAKWLLGNQRILRAERMRAYLAVLRSGLC